MNFQGKLQVGATHIIGAAAGGDGLTGQGQQRGIIMFQIHYRRQHQRVAGIAGIAAAALAVTRGITRGGRGRRGRGRGGELILGAQMGSQASHEFGLLALLYVG